MNAARAVAARRIARGSPVLLVVTRNPRSCAALDIDLELSRFYSCCLDPTVDIMGSGDFQSRSSVRGEFQSRDRCDHFIVNLTTTSATALHPPWNDHGLHDLLEGSLILRRRIHDRHWLVHDKCVDLAACRLSGIAIEAVLGGFGAGLSIAQARPPSSLRRSGLASAGRACSTTRY